MLVLILGVAFAGGRPDPETPQARVGRLLTRGQFDRARERVNALLAKNPEDVGLRLLLAETWLKQGDCDAGLEVAAPLRAEPEWTAEHSRALASCFAGRGEFSEAVYWLEESLLLLGDPQPSRLVQLASYRWDAGDHAGALEALRQAEREEADSEAARLFRARVAVESGWAAAADYWLATFFESRKKLDRHISFLQAALAMDLGDLAGARAAVGEAAPARVLPTQLALEAELARRSGDPQGALDAIDRRPLKRTPVVLLAVRVRALVDLGALEEAEAPNAEALARASLHPEVVASAWYLARARGDAAEMERWAARYAVVNPNPLRTLGSLSPG